MPTNCRLPDKWEKIDGNEMCPECKVEYKKRYKQMFREFVKTKIGKKKNV